jgi:hypothetical protein
MRILDDITNTREIRVFARPGDRSGEDARGMDELVSVVLRRRFFGVRRSLKNVQSVHHASGLKLVPAIGSTSR